ncbi:hypothetical protein AOQ84DRAFT_386190 [Glonium stellatum]|uniref:Uncharacterized protein n=1 Tax=Glonium stellatum TaxID=574774 RepID=A0A8E2JX32_9PEZI|nr:hypothetical protein AOQ84DRAFT_386190 [Glonium stellatum]
MPSKLVKQTTQAAALSAISNIFAQIIAAYRNDKPFQLDHIQMLKFAFCTVLNTPLNCLWQQYLEETFPSQKPAPASSKKPVEAQRSLDASNVFKKLLLDQTLGAAVNTVLYITVMAGMNGASANEIIQAVREGFWPLTLDGYKLWPLFSLVSFLWIPVDKRVLASCAVGMGWGIYLSLLAAEK